MSHRRRAAICAVLTLAVLPVSNAQAGSQINDLELAAKIGGTDAALDPILAALASGRLVRTVAPPAPGSTALPPVTTGFALTGDQLGPLDITGTPGGRDEVAHFVARLRRYGVDTDGMQFTVYTLPPVQEAWEAGIRIGAVRDALDSALVVPTGTPVELVAALWDGRQLLVKTTVAATGQPTPRAFRAFGAPSDSLRWQRAGGLGCVGRKQNSTAHYDPCQWFYKMPDDGDRAHDYWASEMYGTGKGHSVWTLNSLEVDSLRKEGTAAQEWVDWDPGADADTNCHSQTVSVSYAGVGLSLNKQHCEVWDIDKGEEGADMSNWWRGHVRRTERETAAMTATRLVSGAVPTILLDFDYHANP